MKLLRLKDLYVRQLQYLFSPPGLPLVAKADPKGVCTTTVLIRGEAGAGKTTLALALAHSIARSRKGVVLVLNTETAPVEVDAKAAFLGISQRSVVAWSGRSKVKRGTILVQHIALAAAPGEVEEEQLNRPGMLDVLWEMLQTYIDEDPARVPIAAVMVDGMLLSDRDEATGPTRSDTAAFLQALETRGISTVIVEESAPKQASWLPFVVDLVFELQFNIAEDTRKLVRQLVCRKSRYTPAFAGPHEYDLDEGSIPSVWPDPLDIDPEILRQVRMLELLVANAGWIVPRERIASRVWGRDDPGDLDALRPPRLPGALRRGLPGPSGGAGNRDHASGQYRRARERALPRGRAEERSRARLCNGRARRFLRQ